MAVITRSWVAGPPAHEQSPQSRFLALLDLGTMRLLHRPDDSGACAGRGRINGCPVIVYGTDRSHMGGALGTAGTGHIINAIRLALQKNWPVIGLWHSGGARLADGVASMDAVGRMFAMMTRASGRIPQVSVVLGPAAGAAAYGPALTDIVIMSDQACMFVTGPDVVRSVTGEQTNMASLGGPQVHGARSGVAHVTTASEAAALACARRLVTHFTRPGRINLAAARAEQDLRALLPATSRRAYDVHPLIYQVLDSEVGQPAFDELQPRWAPNIVIGLGRLAGRSVGVVANNPLRKGGCLDSPSAEKAARFVRMCDSFGIPLAVLVDVPGYLPGVDQEWNGVIRRGAKLLHAFAEATVPRVTLVTRKAYGGAYIAMNSRALGATAVFTWPEAEVAVMSAEAAVGVLHKKALAAVADKAARTELLTRLIAEQQVITGDVGRAREIGAVDAVIDPTATRYRLAQALLATRTRRRPHGNIPL